MDAQKFENEHVDLTVETRPGCLVKLMIKAKPIATIAASEQAIKNVSKLVNIPGFRKGKAPKEIVTTQFKSKVDKEQSDIIVRSSLNEALKLCQLRPFSDRTQINLIKAEPVDGDSYYTEVEFEAYPQVPSINLKELSLQKVEPRVIEDQEIDEKIEDLRLYHADWQEILDRPAEENDYVTLDIDVIDDKPFSAYKDGRFPFKKIPEWTQKIIQGLKAGESAEGHSEAKDGAASRPCRITVKKIEAPLLPSVDDELAKKAGVNTVDDLKKAVKASLEKDAHLKTQQTMRQNIKKMLAEKYPFDLPESRLKALREECEETTAEDQSRFNPEEVEDYKKNLLAEHLDGLKLSFLLPRLIHEQKLPKPDVQKLRDKVMGYLFGHYRDGLKDIKKEEIDYLTALAENELTAEEALDFLIAQALQNQA